MARWDGEAGVERSGTWHARYPESWARHLISHVDALPGRTKPATGSTATVTLVIEKVGKKSTSFVVDPSNSRRTALWTLVTLIEGVAAQLVWAPVDDGGIRVHLRQRRCQGTGRWYPDGRLIVEAGSRASSAEAPSLTAGTVAADNALSKMVSSR